MYRATLHLRPAVGPEIVAPVAICGTSPDSADYHEITTTDYVTLFMPRQHPRGWICPRCADLFRQDLKTHMRRGD